MSVIEEFEKEFDSEEIEMLVLIKSGCSGAAVYDNMLRPSVDFLASFDLETGTLLKETGRIEWMIKNEKNRKGWGYDFQQFGIYHIKVKKCISKKLKPYQMELLNNRYMLIDIIEDNVTNADLEKLQEYYARPVTIENELGVFELNREFSWFEGEIDWDGIEVSVFMETDEEGGDSAIRAITALLEFANNFKELDKRYRIFAAKQLTELANDWLESDEESELDEISQEMFTKRIEMSEMIFSSSGELTLYYNDDDMFWGHSIEIDIDVSGKAIDANIVG